MNQQILDIWKCFCQYNVKYITIGGFAVNIYGFFDNCEKSIKQAKGYFGHRRTRKIE